LERWEASRAAARPYLETNVKNILSSLFGLVGFFGALSAREQAPDGALEAALLAPCVEPSAIVKLRERALEMTWFVTTRESTRPSARPASVPAPPIDDPEADRWFR
jgi:hypothetical protein